METSNPHRAESHDDIKDTYDTNAGVYAASPPPDDEEKPMSGARGMLKRHRRPLVHLFICLLSTGWWIASLILHRKDKPWVVPFLLWLAINIRLLTFYTGVRFISLSPSSGHGETPLFEPKVSFPKNSAHSLEHLLLSLQ